MGRTAIYGGSFNPIHLGHIRLLTVCKEALSIDQVLLIPAGTPPHKAAPDLAADHHRLAMCRLAVKDLPGITVSDMEMVREGKSYTVLTMRELKAKFPEEKFYFIMGTDMFLSFDRWYEWMEILSYCDLCVSVRAEAEYESLLQKKASLLRTYPELREDFAQIVHADSIEISSTEIRRMIREEDQAVTKFLSEDVLGYIKQKKLYTNI